MTMDSDIRASFIGENKSHRGVVPIRWILPYSQMKGGFRRSMPTPCGCGIIYPRSDQRALCMMTPILWQGGIPAQPRDAVGDIGKCRRYRNTVVIGEPVAPAGDAAGAG